MNVAAPHDDASYDVDVLVVGGGQAALAAGYYLQLARRHGSPDLSFALLDAGRAPGGAWNSGWDTLQLFSPAPFSSLPGFPMPAWAGPGNPSGEHVRTYLRTYEDRYQLPVHRPVRVRNARRSPAGFAVGTETSNGAQDWSCRVLVNATGASRPFWPSYPGMDAFAGRQLHSADYRRAADFDDRTVLVVGGGNSGAQIAADLARREHGSTVWATARPPRFLPDDVDGTTLFELATRHVRAAAAGERPNPGVAGLGDIVMVPPVLAARRRGQLEATPVFDRLTPTGVAWDDPPRRLAADAVVWCTGFRPDLRHLAGLAPTRRAGLPATDPRLRSRSVDDPALFFLGYGDWAGPASATLIGVGATARAAVDAIVHQLGEQVPGVSVPR